MMRPLCVLLLLVLAPVGALAAPAAADFYLISRDPGGSFTGSHRIGRTKSANALPVRYCGKIYWVRPKTVAWSQIEARSGRIVSLEINYGQGWLLLCTNPQAQVRLRDIGIDDDAQTVMRNGDNAYSRRQRFKDIRKSFGE